MRYFASEKFEIIPVVERLRLPAKQTFEMLSISRKTFYAGMRIVILTEKMR